MVIALIAAGGKGKRFGREGGKQYFLINGKPVLYFTLKSFIESEEVDYVLPVINEEDTLRFREVIKSLQKGTEKVLGPVYAGMERVNTVHNGLKHLKNTFGNSFYDSIILIHDGARPFISKNLINRVVFATREFGACVPVVPIPDTLKEISGGKVVKTLDREKIRAVQTPQGFLGKMILSCYDSIDDKNEYFFTDDASLVEHFGYEVFVVDGEKTNIKITYPEDEIFANFYVKKLEEGI
ncbi:MAG: 2-C-methyl-D-erythritol 4-phosphate cytidylyltransferase [Actinobacteria bacterium]|nr:2-C-methyl-D-erythritol 4-phosphate cytidylyltransferase [Actinomycetota bacterium]